MDDLKPCPFCGGAVDTAFENLWDNDDDEIERCWTIVHSCPVTRTDIWVHAATEADAIAAWNTRPTEDALDAADEETFNIGKKEGREEAVQAIDLITGGDGEYRVSTIEGRNCPDAETMISNIEARFTALRAEIARLREASAALIADLREAMPHIDNAIHIAAIHHCPYKGKSLQPAMNALAATLGEQP